MKKMNFFKKNWIIILIFILLIISYYWLFQRINSKPNKDQNTSSDQEALVSKYNPN